MKKTQIKKTLALIICLMLTATLFAGCKDKKPESSMPESSTSEFSSEPVSEEPSEPESGVFKIGLIQFVEHPSLDTIRESFITRLEEWGYDESKVEIDYQNASADSATMNSICQKFVGDEVDLIVAIATPAAQVAVSATQGTDIKVLFAAVNNPAEDLGIATPEAPEGNVTGTSDQIPVQATIDLALATNNITTFGLLYSSGESNSVASAKQAKEYCESLGVEVIEGTVSNSSEIAQVAADLCSKVDVVFTSTDNTIAASLPTVAAAALEADIPFYAGADSMVKDGALAAIGIDYMELGKKNADMAVELIEGRPVNEVPVVFFEKYETYINRNTQTSLRMTFGSEVEDKAIYFE